MIHYATPYELAHSQILLATAELRNQTQADALRLAALRGVRIYLLLDPMLVEAPGSYAAALAFLPEVQIRTLAYAHELLVIDDSLAWLEEPMNPASLSQTFLALWESADVYVPFWQ